MRYVTLLNSQWFEKYQPSKLKVQNKVCLSKEIGLFSVLPTLTADIYFFEPLGVQKRYVPHLKALINDFMDFN